ncbi:MAG TPA: phage holin family protein [Verrucomicrobiae bacterium]|jgi:putative membrane protein|nr:phage holin family protein [Verrucomicrobiae bacterium]
MSPKVKLFLKSWIINTLAVLVAAYIVKGIHYDKPLDLIVAALLLGILNTFIRPLLVLLALPLLILTLGLFLLVINAIILYSVGSLLRPAFWVENFWSAFWGALVIGIISVVLNIMTGGSRARVEFRRRPPNDSNRPDGGGGPVIDV